MSSAISNVRPDPDQVLVDIAEYVSDHLITSQEALNTARYCCLLYTSPSPRDRG